MRPVRRALRPAAGRDRTLGADAPLRRAGRSSSISPARRRRPSSSPDRRTDRRRLTLGNVRVRPVPGIDGLRPRPHRRHPVEHRRRRPRPRRRRHRHRGRLRGRRPAPARAARPAQRQRRARADCSGGSSSSRGRSPGSSAPSPGSRRAGRPPPRTRPDRAVPRPPPRRLRIGLSELAVIADRSACVGATCRGARPGACPRPGSRRCTRSPVDGRSTGSAARSPARRRSPMLVGLGLLAVATVGARERRRREPLGGRGHPRRARRPVRRHRPDPGDGAAARTARRPDPRHACASPPAAWPATAPAPAPSSPRSPPPARSRSAARRPPEPSRSTPRLHPSRAPTRRRRDYTLHHRRRPRSSGPSPRRVRSRSPTALPDADDAPPDARRRQYRHRVPATSAGVQFGFAGNAALVVDDDLADAMRLSGGARAALRDDGIVVVRLRADRTSDVTRRPFDGTSADRRRPPLQPLLARRVAPRACTSRPAFADQLGSRPRARARWWRPRPDAFTEIELFDLQEFSQRAGALRADRSSRREHRRRPRTRQRRPPDRSPGHRSRPTAPRAAARRRVGAVRPDRGRHRPGARRGRREGRARDPHRRRRRPRCPRPGSPAPRPGCWRRSASRSPCRSGTCRRRRWSARAGHHERSTSRQASCSPWSWSPRSSPPSRPSR